MKQVIQRTHISLLATAILTMLVLYGAASTPSFAQYDFTGNGTPDLVLTQVEADGRLRWLAQDVETGAVEDLGMFGQAGYQLNIGSWLRTGEPKRAYVIRDRLGDFELFAEGIDDGATIGQSKTKASVFLGRDSDGSGLNDATLVNGTRRKWSWKFSFDPFSDKASRRRVLFGTKNQIPFLFRARGKYDSLAVNGTKIAISSYLSAIRSWTYSD